MTGWRATLGSVTAVGIVAEHVIAVAGACSCVKSLLGSSLCLLQMACRCRKECAERLMLLLQTAPATTGIANMHIATDASKMNGKAQ